MAQDAQPERQSRQPYEEPDLIVIELKSEEVLATGCKLPDGGPAGASCAAACITNGS